MKTNETTAPILAEKDHNAIFLELMSRMHGRILCRKPLVDLCRIGHAGPHKGTNAALNKLGLSTQVPVNTRYYIDGTLRRIKVYNGKEQVSLRMGINDAELMQESMIYGEYVEFDDLLVKVQELQERFHFI